MKILNFGSLNIDYVYSIDHFVRPGETISSSDLQTFCGGKGLNQSIAIARAGSVVYHAGCIGYDGEILKNYLENNNVNTKYLCNASCKSGHAIIQVDSKGQNCILLYGGANHSITKEYIDSVLENFEKGDLLLLQNEINNIQYLMEQAYQKGMEILLNPSPIDNKLVHYPLQYVKYLLLNEIEGKEISGENNVETITKKLLSKYNDTCIVLTLGKKGVLYIDKQKTLTHGIYEVDVVDTTAAGDTFTGYFVHGIAEKQPMEKVLELASIASSLSVSRCGAADSIPFKVDVKNSALQLIK